MRFARRSRACRVANEHLSRPVDPARGDDEVQYEAGLRPRALDDYIGQDRVRVNLQVSIAAAKGRGDALDHVLLYGPPGLGKTTLAYVIGNELGVPVRATSGPVLERPGDLAAILTNLAEREVLFVDEIHRMPPIIEETLDLVTAIRAADQYSPSEAAGRFAYKSALNWLNRHEPVKAEALLDRIRDPQAYAIVAHLTSREAKAGAV